MANISSRGEDIREGKEVVEMSLENGFLGNWMANAFICT